MGGRPLGGWGPWARCEPPRQCDAWSLLRLLLRLAWLLRLLAWNRYSAIHGMQRPLRALQWFPQAIAWFARLEMTTPQAAGTRRPYEPQDGARLRCARWIRCRSPTIKLFGGGAQATEMRQAADHSAGGLGPGTPGGGSVRGQGDNLVDWLKQLAG